MKVLSYEKEIIFPQKPVKFFIKAGIISIILMQIERVLMERVNNLLSWSERVKMYLFFLSRGEKSRRECNEKWLQHIITLEVIPLLYWKTFSMDSSVKSHISFHFNHRAEPSRSKWNFHLRNWIFVCTKGEEFNNQLSCLTWKFIIFVCWRQASRRISKSFNSILAQDKKLKFKFI